ncbi:MAG: hypothetical protein PHW31_02045 [Candidatus Pacebacteria bacterium]|nr:hypothetical protein [Candidatus Paceibacterota bacterium]
MKNKIIIIILIVLVIALAGAVGVYFFKKTPAGNQKETENGVRTGNQVNTGQPQNKIITDDFSIDLPSGWKQTAPAIGASAMAVNASENIDDPAIQKINFKSYFAVSYDTLQRKSMNDYLQTVKSGLSQAISNVVFTKEQDLTINGRIAHAIEAELAQQGVNFKILMVVVAGQGEDVWVISFNTAKSSWDGYKEMLYDTANSFILKK